jgi:hypothetical protein
MGRLEYLEKMSVDYLWKANTCLYRQNRAYEGREIYLALWEKGLQDMRHRREAYDEAQGIFQEDL